MAAKAHIEAVTVNHNSSLFAELMLRTLRLHHPELPISLTVIDNNSADIEDLQILRNYAERTGIDFATSRFSVEPDAPNSHGESLREFVLAHPDCSHYLFIDPDVYFLSPHTIDEMMAELDADHSAFGIMPRCTWDGVSDHTPKCLTAEEETRVSYKLEWFPGFEMEPRVAKARVQERIHPYCALLRNTPVLQSIAREVGFSFGCTFAPSGGLLWDTMGLATAVMRTHGQRFLRSSLMVHHFFGVSYDTQYIDDKRKRCRKLLDELRTTH